MILKKKWEKERREADSLWNSSKSNDNQILNCFS
jgi:hypothetical protein